MATNYYDGTVFRNLFSASSNSVNDCTVLHLRRYNVLWGKIYNVEGTTSEASQLRTKYSIGQVSGADLFRK